MPSTFYAHHFTKFAFSKVTCASKPSKPISVLSLSSVMVHWHTSPSYHSRCLPLQSPLLAILLHPTPAGWVINRAPQKHPLVFLTNFKFNISQLKLIISTTPGPLVTCPHYINNFLFLKSLGQKIIFGLTPFIPKFFLLFSQKLSRICEQII